MDGITAERPNWDEFQAAMYVPNNDPHLQEIFDDAVEEAGLTGLDICLQVPSPGDEDVFGGDVVRIRETDDRTGYDMTFYARPAPGNYELARFHVDEGLAQIRELDRINNSLKSKAQAFLDNPFDCVVDGYVEIGRRLISRFRR